MTYGLIAGIAVVFGLQIYLGSDGDSLVESFGFVPVQLSEALRGERALEPVLLTLLSSSLLHGGWFHVVGNLLYLRVFGDNVEDRFGHFGYTAFFILGAAVGALAQWVVDPESSVPVIGASGAIAAVLGAYIVMFPKARILTVFPVFIVLTFIEVPALLFLGIWGLQQFLNGYLAITEVAQTTGGSVAWFAHIGGFGLGLIGGVLGRVVHRRRRQRKTSQVRPSA